MKFETLHHFAAADDAWSAELKRLFGKHAGDVRYQAAGKGEPGSKLRALHDARMEAQTAWYEAVNAARKAAAGHPADCRCSVCSFSPLYMGKGG